MVAYLGGDAAPAAHRPGLARRQRPARAGRRADADGARGARGVRGDRRHGRRRVAGAAPGRRRATSSAGRPPPSRRWLRGAGDRRGPPGRARRARCRRRWRRSPGSRSPPYAAPRCSPAPPWRSPVAAFDRRRGGAGRVRPRGRAARCCRCWPPARPTSRPRWPRLGGGAGRDRRQARRHPDPGAPRRRRGAGRDPQPRRHHRPAARGGRGRPRRCRPSGSCSTARRSRWPTTAGPRPFQETASRTATDRRRRRGHAVLLRRAAPRRRATCSTRPATSGSRRSTRWCPSGTGSRAWSPPTPRRAEAFVDAALAAGHEGVVVKRPRRAVRRRPPRRRLGQGQAGAHPRPRGARRRVGQRAAPGLALQHPPRRPRPRRAAS